MPVNLAEEIQMVRILKKDSGFTLIELLVTVAIVGVLATAGIPQYRRMVQKAKKSEAKVLLGDIANAESAFFSEFGAYGSNLVAMGVEVGNFALGAANPGASFIYTVGFTQANCAGLNGAPVPATSTSWGASINASNPTYYTTKWNPGTTGTSATQGSEVFGRLRRTANCRASTPFNATFSNFTAAASGTIASGVDLDTGTTDQWTMNQQRVLVNVVDGIN